MDHWYLSFDCATKTLAYILVKIKPDHLFIDTNELRKVLKHLEHRLKTDGYSIDVHNAVKKIDDKLNNTIQIISGDCVDLFPGIYNKDINTINRIKALSVYINKDIKPIINNIPHEQLHVLVEFQMSFNTQSKIISTALLTLFADYDIQLINPSLKNKLYFNDKGHYCYFMEKYKSSYLANKNHALYNYLVFEQVFNQSVNLSNKLKGHVADAFMQILGYLIIK